MFGIANSRSQIGRRRRENRAQNWNFKWFILFRVRKDERACIEMSQFLLKANGRRSRSSWGVDVIRVCVCVRICVNMWDFPNSSSLFDEKKIFPRGLGKIEKRALCWKMSTSHNMKKQKQKQSGLKRPRMVCLCTCEMYVCTTWYDVSPLTFDNRLECGGFAGTKG